MMDANSSSETVYCGVVIVNGILGALNLLCSTWLARDRRNADRHRSHEFGNVMRRLDNVSDAVGPDGPAACDARRKR